MTGIPEWQLSRLSAFVAARMGLRFARDRWRNLERGINAAARELGLEDGKSCIEWLLSSSPTRSQIEILAGHLTIGETYFFRDKKLFRILEESVLVELIRLRRNSGKYLRIWSAGCSSGEEPYSVAILLSKMIPDIGEWNISILATDINTRLLRKAAGGVYGQWSFRDIQPGIKEVFFHTREDGRLELHSRIRKMVTFSYLNLVEDTYPSLVNNTNAVDIIFCRNVLMYLVPEIADKVVGKFHRSLVDGGFLIVSPTESSHAVGSRFTAVRTPGTILYRKAGPRGAGEYPSEPALGSVPGALPVAVPCEDRTAPRPEAYEAFRELQTATSKEDGPDREDLHREALTLYEGGAYPEAAEKVEKLLSKNPADADGLELLAHIYANWGKLEKALECCEKAIAVEKLHAGYHYLMATILEELGRTEDAVISFKRTLYLDTNFTLAYVALGNISRKSGRHKESAKHFENALALLNSGRSGDVLPGSEGLNAERLIEIIETMRKA